MYVNEYESLSQRLIGTFVGGTTMVTPTFTLLRALRCFERKCRGFEAEELEFTFEEIIVFVVTSSHVLDRSELQ